MKRPCNALHAALVEPSMVRFAIQWGKDKKISIAVPADLIIFVVLLLVR
jgi:hypothetical protein